MSRDVRILAVDDEPSNLVLLQRILTRAGYEHVDTMQRSSEVYDYFVEHPPDLLLLDLHMPHPDGFAVMQLLQRWTTGDMHVPVVVLTADAARNTRYRALEAGARDFLVKPLDQTEVLLRIGNVLQTRALQLELQRQNASLDEKVRHRTEELDRARLEAFRKLSLAAEYRDDETRQHTQRVGHVTQLVALELGMDPATAEILKEVAPLHDIGKIGIPDAILLKPGPLSDEEFATMKQHTRIGAGILGGTQSPFFAFAKEIALSHHERWDGSGYPQGLAGEQIPLAARIVGLVDAFDAMSHQRPYKPATPLDETLQEIDRSSGSHFDPTVVEAFAQLEHATLLDLRADARRELSPAAWQLVREIHALELGAEVFQELFERLPYGLVIANNERYCVAANAAARDLLGMSATELKDRRIDELTPVTHKHEPEAIWSAFERSAGAATATSVLLGSDGERVPVRYDVHPDGLAGHSVTVLAWLGQN